MKYVDNLLDWADSLFTKFERESLNEAVMLYVLARDILGDPPVELGQCGEEGIAPATFEDIAPAVKGEQGFVVDMENWKTPALVLGANTNRFVTTRAMTAAADPPDEDEGDRELWRYSPRAGTSEDLGTSLIGLLGGGFCVPGNKALRKYWERVEGRLYNIRHCLDIHGVPRAPAPFAPEIDPALLAEAGATGLALDDVTDAISGSLPPYRFTALVERAKSYAATLQSFGAELFSALEKKDAEALNRLRTVHQQNLLGLTTRIREDEITAAQDAIDGLGFRKAGAEYQLGHYQSLLDTGLIAPESTQMDAQMLALLMKFAGGTVGALTGVLHLVPDVGAPTALKYGGSSLGASMGSFAGAVGSFASVFDSQAASAGLTASFDRRKQGWEHQIKLAKQEIEQLGKQLEGAEMRKRIAERSLEIHQQSIEHLDEISGFYREKFSNLGLYTWLSTTLQRLYRETYQSAWAMARLAEQAYRFERDDDSGLVATGVWDTFRTGLLAGERLLVDLQTMERRFLETDSRSLELDQAFSLSQIDPAALISLKETGACEFEIGELFFDLFYPGHYRRRIQNVRLTMPCITGPYTNVSATLTLQGSKIRREPMVGATKLLDVPRRHSVSIATSTAQNDAGVFELSFRDPRYMPFEGAGAVSRWKLSLPSAFRQFDYQIINDVVLHLGYTAEENDALRGQVEALNSAVEGTLLNMIENASLARVFSFRHDFSGSFNRLKHSALGTVVPFTITEKHFPIFLRGRAIHVTRAHLAIRAFDSQALGTLTFHLDGHDRAGFTAHADLVGLLGTADMSADYTGGLVGAHTIEVKDVGGLAPDAPSVGDPSALDEDKLLDIVLYFEYSVGAQ